MQPLIKAFRTAARTTGIRLALWAVLSCAASWYALSHAGELNDFRDAHMLQSYERVGAKTVREYAQWPLWNPYSCGGMYAAGGPQTRVTAPTVLLSAAMGTERAEALLVFLFMVLGMEGAFRYARLRLRSGIGALLAAPFFALNGYFAISWTLGWINFFGFELLPWLLLGTAWVVRGRAAGFWLVAGGFAFMMAFGGTYPVPLCALFVVLEAVRQLASKPVRTSRSRLLRGAFMLGAGALLTLAACAFRLWPILETMQSAPRVMAGTPAHSILEVIRMTLFLAPPPGVKGAFATQGIFYVGPALLLLAAAAVLSRRAIVPALVAAVTVWIATGYATSPVAPFVWLRELPVMETLRYPYRFLLAAGLFVVELGAISVAALLWKARRNENAELAVGALCAVAVLGWGMQVNNFRVISHRAELAPMPPVVEQPFAQARGNRWVQGHFVALNRGSINCGEAYPVPMSDRLRGDLAQEEYLEDAFAGSAKRTAWSPNRIDVDVALDRPTFLLVNQNYHPGWHASEGEVVSRDGLLAVRLPAGSHHVSLRFRPRSALGGGIVSLLAFAGLGAVSVVSRRRSRSRMNVALIAAAVVPLVAWGVVLVAWKEPPLPPVLRNPNGAPIQVDTLPEGATPVGANFDVPVELVAAQVGPAPDEDGIEHVQLFWRLKEKAPHTLGVFVHLVDPDGGFKGADHELIAGTYFFDTAPTGVLLRDAFGANASDYKPGTWKVMVGLWHASGNGQRVPVRDAQGAAAPEHRVLVGSFVVPPKPSADKNP